MKESSKRAKCQCGKTKDPNRNCDGSHANTNRIIKSILFTLVIFAGSVFYANATSLVKENKIDVKESTVIWKGHKVTGSHEGEILKNRSWSRRQGQDLLGERSWRRISGRKNWKKLGRKL